MSKRLTEEALTESFKKIVASPITGAWKFNGRPISYLLTEFDAKEGLADVVLIPSNPSKAHLEWMARVGRGVATPGAALVLASLPKGKGIAHSEISRMTGLSRKSVHSMLTRLEAAGLARRLGQSDRYSLNRLAGDGGVEIWAYELKLSDWSKALYQASQYRVFAHSVAVVLAKEYAHRVKPRLDHFRRFNIGVVVLDSGTGRTKSLLRSRPANPQSRSHYLYAVSELARRVLESPDKSARRRVTGGVVKRLPAETLHNPPRLRHGV